MQTMGEEGLHWTPFLLTMFRFIFVDKWEVIRECRCRSMPHCVADVQALRVVLYHYIGSKKQGSSAT